MKAFVKKYERHLSAFAFASGYLIDNLTMIRVDVWFDHVILLAHLFVAAIAIILFNAYILVRDKDLVLGRAAAKVFPWLPIAIQFGLGSVFSGSLVFYSKSGSLSASWP